MVARARMKLLFKFPFLIGSNANIFRPCYSPHYCQWQRPKRPITRGLKAGIFRWLCLTDWGRSDVWRLLSDESVFVITGLLDTIWCSLLRRQDPQVRPMKCRRRLAATNEAAAGGGCSASRLVATKQQSGTAGSAVKLGFNLSRSSQRDASASLRKNQLSHPVKMMRWSQFCRLLVFPYSSVLRIHLLHTQNRFCTSV